MTIFAEVDKSTPAWKKSVVGWRWFGWAGDGANMHAAVDFGQPRRFSSH
jgi:hypothetical protein